MNKNKKKRVGVALLVLLAVISCYAVAKTYAKYATTVKGTDTARVAKWAWTINSADLDYTNKTFTMDLFSNSVLLDSNCTDLETSVSSDTDKVIAPGTCGKFEITIKNNSEVDATYEYSLKDTNTSNLPIKYSSDKSTWVDNIEDLSVSATAIAKGDTSTPKTIYWKWDFAGDDTTDTDFGIAGTAELTVEADLVLNQVD